MDEDRTKFWGFLSLIVFGIGLVCFLLLYRTETTGRVTGFQWQTGIDIQRYQTVREDDWSVPVGGRLVYTNWEYHYTSHTYVGSHEECNGYGENKSCYSVSDYRDDPVYDNKYYYDIDRWVFNRRPQAKGNDQKWYWPDVSDIRTEHNPAQVDDERASTRYSAFTVFFASEGKSYSLDVPEERWSKTVIEHSCVLVLNVFGNIMDYKGGTQ